MLLQYACARLIPHAHASPQDARRALFLSLSSLFLFEARLPLLIEHIMYNDNDIVSCNCVDARLQSLGGTLLSSGQTSSSGWSSWNSANSQSRSIQGKGVCDITQVIARRRSHTHTTSSSGGRAGGAARVQSHDIVHSIDV